MGKIENNLMLNGVSGMVGEQLVVRETRGKLVLCKRPKGRKITSEKQEAIQARFEEATQYAARQMKRPESNAEYETGITSRKHSAYVVAVSDYLNVPKVHYIDALTYEGKIADKIIIKATDDFMVKAVHVEIFGSDGALLEKGEAGPDVDLDNVWIYEATVANATLAGTKITAKAVDKPRNVTALSIVL